MSMISAIVAVDSNWGIGKDNELLFHIKEDLKRFKELTMNKVVIMGRKTWDSLPSKPLPNRTNVIMTKNNELLWHNDTKDTIYMTDKMVESALANEIESLTDTGNHIFFIGGGQIYRKYLGIFDRVYVTKVLDTKDSDTYFENLDKSDEWECVSESELKEENNIQYKFCIYERIK